jgi:hypothetical protein
MDDKTHDEVETLLDQLQAVSVKVKEVKKERDPITKEELEKFTIENGAALVQDALEMVATVKDFIISAPNAEDVEALAGLIKAASSAIDSLNHLTIQDKRSTTSVKLKEMDIASRKELQQDSNTHKLLATREEIFKMLVDKAKPVEAELIENKRID